MYSYYKKQPSFVLGFHGCDESLGEAIHAGNATLAASENEYNWLGTGIYFWEGNPARAMRFAQEAATRPKTTKGQSKAPFVVGASIDLGLCCNLHDQSTLEELSKAHELLKITNASAGVAMPENKVGSDRLMRYLDCAVVNYQHTLRDLQELRRYDTVRAVFHEGGQLYVGSGFTKQAHVQVAVREEGQILGYFRPRLTATG